MTYTADSALLAPPTVHPVQAHTWLVQHGSVYTSYDLGLIVGYYFDTALHVGLDPILAIAQCAHETSAQQPNGSWFVLSSWWAKRPRRNPAGLGCSGASRTTQPKDPQNWAYHEGDKCWYAGMSFPSWEHSARAHIGRLLAYALTDEQANTAQRVLISETLGERGIRADYRGAAPVLRGLQGRWAVPGKTYASKIAGIANSIAAVKLPKQTGQMP